MAGIWVAAKDSGALQVDVVHVRSIHSSTEVDDTEGQKMEMWVEPDDGGGFRSGDGECGVRRGLGS